MKLFPQVHRLVLAMTSPVFEEMLFGSSVVGRELALPNDPPDGFNWLLTHMYGGNTELPCEKIALQVSFLASKYKIKALYSLCSKVSLSPAYCKRRLFVMECLPVVTVYLFIILVCPVCDLVRIAEAEYL